MAFTIPYSQLAALDTIGFYLRNRLTSLARELMGSPDDLDLLRFYNETREFVRLIETYKRNFPLRSQGSLL